MAAKAIVLILKLSIVFHINIYDLELGVLIYECLLTLIITYE